MANIVKEKELKRKTFSIRERDAKVVRHAKNAIIQYKHLDNMLNIILKEEYFIINNLRITFPNGKSFEF